MILCLYVMYVCSVMYSYRSSKQLLLVESMCSSSSHYAKLKRCSPMELSQRRFASIAVTIFFYSCTVFISSMFGSNENALGASMAIGIIRNQWAANLTRPCSARAKKVADFMLLLAVICYIASFF